MKVSEFNSIQFRSDRVCYTLKEDSSRSHWYSMGFERVSIVARIMGSVQTSTGHSGVSVAGSFQSGDLLAQLLMGPKSRIMMPLCPNANNQFMNENVDKSRLDPTKPSADGAERSRLSMRAKRRQLILLQ